MSLSFKSWSSTFRKKEEKRTSASEIGASFEGYYAHFRRFVPSTFSPDMTLVVLGAFAAPFARKSTKCLRWDGCLPRECGCTFFAFCPLTKLFVVCCLFLFYLFMCLVVVSCCLVVLLSCVLCLVSCVLCLVSCVLCLVLCLD